MKLIPDFLLRSATRLLLVHKLFAWILLQAFLTDPPLVLRLGLIVASQSVVLTTESLLSLHAGFELPSEGTFFLPMLFNQYARDSMPELATFLGISPCWHDIVYKDKIKQCTQDLAHTCFQHARIENGKKSLQIIGDCYEDYGISASEASKHQKQCHVGDDFHIVGPLACIRAKKRLMDKAEISLKVFPGLECTMIYALWDLITPTTNNVAAWAATRGSSKSCWREVNPNDWTVSVDRTGVISRLLKHVDWRTSASLHQHPMRSVFCEPCKAEGFVGR